MSPSRQLVGVAMSGGVDSSVAAYLLKEAGHKLLGFTLVLRDRATRSVTLADAERAATVARHFGIEHLAIDARDIFEQEVIRPFAQAYADGKTPSPCVVCNPRIKFGFLLEKARELGCSSLATGHYVRRGVSQGKCSLYIAVDRAKDQSYFLQRLLQSQLQQSLFPLAELTKRQVRELAEVNGLPIPSQPESQDLCFVDEEHYAAFVEGYHPELKKPGDILDEAGQVLGQHEGFHNFTLGQRKGLGVASHERLYVCRIDPAANTVTLGTRSSALKSECTVHDLNWISGSPPRMDREYQVKTRFRQQAVPARLTPLGDDGIHIHFKTPQFAVTPGQAAAIYDGEILLGGGWIE